METAQDDAVVAALRADGQTVIERPAVYSVTIGGPAHQRLLPGDLVISVDGVPTLDGEGRTRRASSAHQVGETVIFTVIRAKQQQRVKVITAESTTQSDAPVVGITLGTGYDYAPDISFDLGQQIGGPSAGLVFALAIYDKITEEPLLGGRHVAGTGTITPTGEVGPIGGIQEKIAGAEKAGATEFLVPAGNCADLDGLRTDVRLIRVSTLRDAIAALQTLNTPGRPARCRAADADSGRTRPWWPRWSSSTPCRPDGWDPAAAVRPGADRRARRAEPGSARAGLRTTGRRLPAR